MVRRLWTIDMCGELKAMTVSFVVIDAECIIFLFLFPVVCDIRKSD